MGAFVSFRALSIFGWLGHWWRGKEIANRWHKRLFPHYRASSLALPNIGSGIGEKFDRHEFLGIRLGLARSPGKPAEPLPCSLEHLNQELGQRGDLDTNLR